jgi:Phytanoyl-CoA dioxygenase (PhyH)
VSSLRLQFGIRNTHGLASNLVYSVHRRYSRLRSAITPTRDGAALAARLAETGVAVLGVSDVPALASLVERELAPIPLDNGYAQLPRVSNPKVVPHLFRILQEHRRSIEACIGSHFRVNWFEVQKIAPGEQPKGSSFGYHSDDTPTPVFKLFVYLTDTHESNGAFRAFPYAVTDELLRRGMLDSVHPGERRARAQALVPPELEARLMVVEGRAGTVFLFDNNLIHKGTLPRHGTRTHVSLELMPWPRPMTEQELAQGCDQEIKRYFPANPFRP